MSVQTEAIRALGNHISAREAAEILAYYYNYVVGILSVAARSNPGGVKRSKEAIQKARIWEAIKDLKTRDTQIISRPSADFNALIKYIGILEAEASSHNARLEVRTRSIDEALDAAKEKALEFGKPLADAAAGVGESAKTLLQLLAQLAKYLPLILLLGLAVVGFVYAKNLGLIGK